MAYENGIPNKKMTYLRSVDKFLVCPIMKTTLFLLCIICLIIFYRVSCEFESRSWRGVLDTTLCDKICQ